MESSDRAYILIKLVLRSIDFVQSKWFKPVNNIAMSLPVEISLL